MAAPSPHRSLAPYGWAHIRAVGGRGPAQETTSVVGTRKLDTVTADGRAVHMTLTTLRREIDPLTAEERARAEGLAPFQPPPFAGPPAEPGADCHLLRLQQTAPRALATVLSFCDLPTLGRLSSTCRALAWAQWPVVEIRKRARAHLSWESNVPMVVFRRPQVLILPGNPDRHHPLHHEHLLRLIAIPGLRVLALHAAHCGDKGAAAVADLLAAPDCSLIWLDLTNNQITEKGAARLGAALATNRSLEGLLLDNNRIGNDGAAALGAAVATHPCLATLSLSSNHLTSGECLGSLGDALGQPGCRLQRLDLASNSFGAEAGAALATGLGRNQSLLCLNLRRCKLFGRGSEALSAALASNTHLRAINLEDNNIHAVGARALGQQLSKGGSACALASLVLAWNDLGNVGLRNLTESLAAPAQLVYLDLSCNGIDEDGAKTLADWLAANPQLEALRLAGGGGEMAHAQGGEIRDAGAALLAAALGSNSHLRHLYLPLHGIRDKGAAAFGQALETNTALLTLDLSANKIKAGGAEQLGQSLARNTTLENLDLSGNEIHGSGARALADGLSGNTRLTALHLSMNKLQPEDVAAVAKALAAHPTLASLDLSANIPRAAADGLGLEGMAHLHL